MLNVAPKASAPATADLAALFRKNGWAVASVFDAKDIEAFIDALSDVLAMQMRKLNLKPTGDINADTLALNAKSSVALTECLLIARNTAAGHRLACAEKLHAHAAEFLSADKKLRLVISGPSFFVNIPSSSERKYTWHSEQNWYPKRRSFLNIWCPVIHDRVNNDSMAVMTGSHKKDWFYFSEYSGYGGVIDENANVQYEIPESFLTDYQGETPAVRRGEGLFFNGKLVHRSLDNTGTHPLFTIVFRVFDYSEDLTLSSNWADLPYNRKSIGYPDINVKP